MHKLPPISLGREEAAEILSMIDPVTKALEGLPYSKARPAIDLVDSIRETICEALPGGNGTLCDGCGLPFGQDEGAYGDDVALCSVCFPGEPSQEEADAGDVDAVDQAKGDMAFSFGWIDWTGGDCPLHPDAMVEVTLRDGSHLLERVAHLGWRHDIPEDTDKSREVIAYRFARRASLPSVRLVPRYDGAEVADA